VAEVQEARFDTGFLERLLTAQTSSASAHGNQGQKQA